MIVFGTSDEAARTRFSRTMSDGRRVWRSQFFGPAPSPAAASTLNVVTDEVVYVDPLPGERRPPQAFLVEQEAGATVAPHFHYVDQFQVVVAGGGSLGRHPVAPLSVHFAGASTGYGPISPGEQGLSYFTFRAAADETGAQYLPQARPRMRDGTRRNVVVERIELSGKEAIRERSRNVMQVVLSNEDGLAVFMVRLAPNQPFRLPDASSGNGLSLLVTGGELIARQQSLLPWACGYVSADEGELPVTAGSIGAEVLVLRYPKTAG